MKLRVGLVGLGNDWDSRYRPALNALSDRFEVRAVCEEVAHLAESAARQFSAVAVDGYQAMLRRDDIDALLMLAPQWYGALPILAACDAGKSVYCATSLVTDPAQATLIKERVERSGVAFMAEFPRRHAPATLRLKELIATSLGPPRLLFCHHRLLIDENGSRRLPPWQQQMNFVLMELVDWCHYVMQREPKSVMGTRHCNAPEGDADYVAMSVDFSDDEPPGFGPLAQISCGHYMPRNWHEAVSFRPPAHLQVRCENGIAFIDLPTSITWFDEAGRHHESLDSERPVGEQLLLRFHRSVTSLVRNLSDLGDAYRAIQVVLASQQSAAEGQRVSLR